MGEAELTPTGRVILGMIRGGRGTGYDIKQLVDVSTRFFWAASYGQIYPELRRLEEQGLILGEPDPSGGRARTVYELTADGERALDDWLSSDEVAPPEIREEGLLKLFFSEGRDPEEIGANLAAMRANHEAIVARLREAHEEPDDPEPGPGMVLEFGIAFHEWIAGWLTRAEERVSREAAER